MNSKNFDTIRIRFLSLSGATAFVVLSLAASAWAERATVQHDRSNVRARPSTTSEVVAQLSKGDSVDVLEHKSMTEKGKPMDWLHIPLPATAKCFVSAKLISDGAAKVDAVNVRSGPGTHYRDVGKLAKGDRVEVVKTTGEWLEVKPTEHCTGWIAADLVKVEAGSVAAPAAASVAPVPPLPPVSSDRAEVVTPPVSFSSTPAPAVPAIRVVDTDPDVRVTYVVKDGVLHSVKEANAPAAYELMNSLEHRICYVDPVQMNLRRYEGKNVRLAGNQHWRKSERYPVLIVERVDMIW
jgi:uncharacterized protein YgiM (DUF1202 family)